MIILSTVLAFAAFAGLLSVAGCSGESGSRSAASGHSAKPGQPAAADQATSKPAAEAPSQPARPQVVMETSMGRIVLELFPQRAPETVANFLKYTDEKFYDGTLFHRVMKGFMIQGGGFNADGSQREPTHPPVRNESRLGGSNARGTIAMARTSLPDSATCQFFINTVDNKGLDFPLRGGYTVFGRVIEGMDVVDRIADVQVAQSPISNAQPLENVVIVSVRRK